MTDIKLDDILSSNSKVDYLEANMPTELIQDHLFGQDVKYHSLESTVDQLMKRAMDELSPKSEDDFVIIMDSFSQATITTKDTSSDKTYCDPEMLEDRGFNRPDHVRNKLNKLEPELVIKPNSHGGYMTYMNYELPKQNHSDANETNNIDQALRSVLYTGLFSVEE